MSDLISRKALLNELSKLDITKMYFPDAFKELVEKQLIAYDLDGVLDDLKILDNEYPYKIIGIPETYTQYNEGWQDCLDRVEWLVKKGGCDE